MSDSRKCSTLTSKLDASKGVMESRWKAQRNSRRKESTHTWHSLRTRAVSLCCKVESRPIELLGFTRGLGVGPAYRGTSASHGMSIPQQIRLKRCLDLGPLVACRAETFFISILTRTGMFGQIFEGSNHRSQRTPRVRPARIFLLCRGAAAAERSGYYASIWSRGDQAQQFSFFSFQLD